MQIKHPIKTITTSLLLITLLSACGSGGSGSNTNNGNTPNGLSIQSVASITSILTPSYNQACMYSYGTNTYLVKTDGSGTGVSLNTSTGQLSQVNSLPPINSANGDTCLVNSGELTWYNQSNPLVVNVYDPFTSVTTSVDLSSTTLSVNDIPRTSFMLANSGSTLYASNNFANDGSVGVSKFNLTTSPVRTYTQLSNSQYSTFNFATPVVFGFWGVQGSSLQMYPTDNTNNLPAMILWMLVAGGGHPEQQTIQTITDTNMQPITAMSAAWDWTPAAQGVVVTAGMVQPVIYRCPASNTIANNFTCDKTYTSSVLTTKYRIMRLLGGNSNKVYFMGMNLANSTVDIFSMDL